MVTTPNEFTLELYRQAWQQARHNELLRAGYVALYTLVIATVVGLLGQDKFRYPVGPYCFLGFLSLLGVLLSWRFLANANRWTRLQKASPQQLKAECKIKSGFLRRIIGEMMVMGVGGANSIFLTRARKNFEIGQPSPTLGPTSPTNINRSSTRYLKRVPGRMHKRGKDYAS